MALKVNTVVPFLVMSASAVSVGVLVTLCKFFGPVLLMNETPSEPVGIYRLVAHAPKAYARGMYVVFPVPETVQPWVYGRGWLRNHEPFLKELAGLAGDRVCVAASQLTVNDAYVGPVFAHDSNGGSLPQHPGCFVVPDGYFFPASRYLAKSFDGRYFGALPITLLRGEARPLWTF